MKVKIILETNKELNLNVPPFNQNILIEPISDIKLHIDLDELAKSCTETNDINKANEYTSSRDFISTLVSRIYSEVFNHTLAEKVGDKHGVE